MSDDNIKQLGHKTGCPYGIHQSTNRPNTAAIGTGDNTWLLTTDELREIIADVENEEQLANND